MTDHMNDSKDGHFEKKMQMMKMREEMLNSMGDKELRAFIKGYMMAEHMVFKQVKAMCGCQDGGCREGSSCKTESCACGKEECNCSKQ